MELQATSPAARHSQSPRCLYYAAHELVKNALAASIRRARSQAQRDGDRATSEGMPGEGPRSDEVPPVRVCLEGPADRLTLRVLDQGDGFDTQDTKKVSFAA